MRGGENCVIKDLKLVSLGDPGGDIDGPYLQYAFNCIIDNIIIDAITKTTNSGRGIINISDYGIHNVVKNCKISKITNFCGIALTDQIASLVLDNFIIECSVYGYGSIMTSNTCIDCEISRNEITFYGNSSHGSSNFSRR
jgi:hypothetical protein